MHSKQLLIIGLVWPEPTSSASGTRMIQLVNLFLANGYEITFASAAAKSEYSIVFPLSVREAHITLNDEGFNRFVQQLNPTIVMFDRFMIEEQYGWRVEQECPNALQILDTEDLHFLRKAREQADRQKIDFSFEQLYTDEAKREIAAILRCDLSLIISKVEIKVLTEQFKIDESILFYLPFLEENITNETVRNWSAFEHRKDFIFIGNFLHEPNWKTVLTLKNEVWPQLSKLLPGAHLNIYGAYPSQKVSQLNSKQDRFFVKGRANDAKQILAKHKILLAPTRIGAGLKGKFIDAMLAGTPSVTTSIGAEGMGSHAKWPGYVSDNLADFIQAAANLYTIEETWLGAQKNGIEVINAQFSIEQFAPLFISALEKLTNDLAKHRQHNFIGQVLQHHTLKSTKYLSLWIEEKNRKSN